MPLKLYNTLTRTIEEFTPLHPPEVTMYNCGPTVYNFAHIGNLRAYVFADVLRRTLEMNGYAVKQVINITDVGHLVSDADEGEDKMLVGAKREGKSVEEIIKLYSDAFYDDLAALNIKAATDRGKEEYFPRATHHISEQKMLIEDLAQKGFTYQTADGIYFDTSRFPTYGKFARLDVAGMQAGTRVGMGEKKHPTDFALWKFSPEDGQKREQEWDSPLGITRKGFPGWHIECSAMSRKYLGQPFDIHTGGVDHIPVHHTNEIAQSVAAYGVPLANVWMHSAHMLVEGQKMSKSLGNTFRLKDLEIKGVSQMAYRYWLLTAGYRTQVNFTWSALQAAQHTLEGLYAKFLLMKAHWNPAMIVNAKPEQPMLQEFATAINDDLNTAKGIALLNRTIRHPVDATGDAARISTVLALDEVLQLNFRHLSTLPAPPIPGEKIFLLEPLMNARKSACESKNFTESDRLRDEIKKLGYEVKDTPDGQVLTSLS